MPASDPPPADLDETALDAADLDAFLDRWSGAQGGEPADAGAVAARFAGAGPRTVAPVLDALAELGLLRTEAEGVYAA